MNMLKWMSACTAILIAVFIGIPAVSAQDDDPKVLSAYFGLDNSLPFAANALCFGGGNMDGMPVVFSHSLNPDTLQAQDFAVVTQSGKVHTPRCATLAPAVDVGEMNSVLLIGDLGDSKNDPPLRVEVVGDILSGSGDPDQPSLPEDKAFNFKDLSVDVTPLDAGPFLVNAQVVPEDQWHLDAKSGRQQGSGCPSKGTIQIVRATWAGGITKPNNDEVDDLERQQYTVTVLVKGKKTQVVPFALGDLGDGDNNHLLCLDVEGEPVSVFFAAGYVMDPNKDTLNPDTEVAIQVEPATEPMPVKP